MVHQGKLQHFQPGEGIRAGSQSVDFDDAGWLDVAIPGDVHRTLIDAGRIPDPFYGLNETECRWMEDQEWWYRFELGAIEAAAPDERLRLVFLGLDTYATIWLNGEEIGQHQNMFRPAVFDVTDRLRSDAPNVVAIRFDPPLQCTAGKTVSQWGPKPERTPMRKAQFGYGWDWGPRLPTIGIWRPVELKRERGGIITGVHFATLDVAPDRDRAAVRIRVEAERFAGREPLTARVRLTPPDHGALIEHELSLGDDGPDLGVTAYLTVDHPHLWWTHDLGDPSLYELTVTLLEDGTTVDEWTDRAGIRTLTLDQSPDPDERGTRFFRFVLNGMPIFARGADWIPCDSFVGAIPPERYTRLLESARDANMTMLRVWGGGIYEDHHFYEECDRLGILVWQDFMFACAMYSEDDPVFVAEVEAEARYQVPRLRSHPCLALWCGNNENQWLHDGRFWNEPDPPAYGELYYHKILPEVVAALDGQTPYWPSSPFGGDDHNDQRQGNRHNWDVWHGQYPRRFGEQPHREFTPESVSYLRYADDLARFVSEFGMHAAPVLETLRRVIPDDQLYHHSPAMDWHNKDNPKDKGDMLMQGTTGVPADLAEYIDFSQLAQAEGLKFGIEHYRRRKPHCSGTLVWQLNDCWPVQSWSVLDYYGFGKASYFYLKRVYHPVLASFKPKSDGGIELWLTNDSLEEVADTLTIRLAGFDGTVVWECQHDVAVPANSSQSVAAWDAAKLGRQMEHYISVQSANGRFPANRHFFAALKDLQRHPAEPEMTITRSQPRALTVDLTAQPTAYDMLVHLTTPYEGTRYSDNYFDLAPGERRMIMVTNAETDLRPEDITLGWR